MAAPVFDVFVGAETGLLKGFNVNKQIWDNVNSLETADKSYEICSMCWNDLYSNVLCIGLKNHSVKLFDTKSGTFLEPCMFSGCEGKLKSLVSVGDQFISGADCGKIYSWKEENTQEIIDTKGPLSCMVQNPYNKHIISSGGKENDLNLWDLNNATSPIFQAKNVKNDWLNLRVPVWVMDTCFLKNDQVITSTGYHQVRIYDYKSSQRRPVLDMEFDEYPITAISLVNTHDNQVIVGNTQGKMGLLDIRKGKLIHLFKGFAGGIRSINCHETKPIVASCGLDRFLRVHDIESKALLYKVYLKSRLNCVVMTPGWSVEEDRITENTDENTEDVDTEKGSDIEETDDIWDKMKVVMTRTVKKSEDADTNITGFMKKKRKLDNVNTDNGVPVVVNISGLKKSRKKKNKQKVKE